jgi:ATP-dependent Clp protease adaptor protein ClpS
MNTFLGIENFVYLKSPCPLGSLKSLMVERKRKYIDSPEFNQVVDQLPSRSLILHDDDVNTFDFVIKSLIEVCEHNLEQAEQCTYIVHYKGKCDVKRGTYPVLKPLKDGLVSKGLTATID